LISEFIGEKIGQVTNINLSLDFLERGGSYWELLGTRLLKIGGCDATNSERRDSRRYISYYQPRQYEDAGLS
jgi:hypothetical protein